MLFISTLPWISYTSLVQPVAYARRQQSPGLHGEMLLNRGKDAFAGSLLLIMPCGRESISLIFTGCWMGIFSL